MYLLSFHTWRYTTIFYNSNVSFTSSIPFKAIVKKTHTKKTFDRNYVHIPQSGGDSSQTTTLLVFWSHWKESRSHSPMNWAAGWGCTSLRCENVYMVKARSFYYVCALSTHFFFFSWAAAISIFFIFICPVQYLDVHDLRHANSTPGQLRFMEKGHTNDDISILCFPWRFSGSQTIFSVTDWAFPTSYDAIWSPTYGARHIWLCTRMIFIISWMLNIISKLNEMRWTLSISNGEWCECVVGSEVGVFGWKMQNCGKTEFLVWHYFFG